MEETEISTSRFSLRPASLAYHVLMHRAGKFWLIVSLPIIVSVICGLLYDSRILFITAAIIFVLFPTLRMLSYNDLMTRPWNVDSIYPHQVVVSPTNDISVTYFPMPKFEQQDKASDDENSDDNNNDSANADSEQPPRPVRVPEAYTIPYAAIQRCHYWDKYLVITYEPTDHHIAATPRHAAHRAAAHRALLIPLKAFTSPTHINALFQRLNKD